MINLRPPTWKFYGLIVVLICLLYYTLKLEKAWKIKENRSEHFQFVSDVAGYYGYLPEFFNKDSERFTQDRIFPNTSVVQTPKDHFVPKYTFGTAFMYLPGYLISESILWIRGITPEVSGLSSVHSKISTWNARLFGFLGIFFLYLLLRRNVNQFIVAACLLGIIFGTNFFYYFLDVPMMSHTFLFFHLSLLLYLCDRFKNKPRIWHLLLIAFSVGLSALIRPTTGFIYGVIVLILLLNNSTFAYLKSNWWVAPSGLLIMIIPFLSQMIFWKVYSGHFMFDTYIDEPFFFLDPEFKEYLIGYRKGWITYSPYVIFPLIGIFFLLKEDKTLFYASITGLCLAFYLNASWWCWWYGGSFGSRSMIDFYPLLILPMIYLIERLMKSKWLAVIPLILILYSVELSYNFTEKYYWHGIHYDSMTKEAFWYSFTHKQMIWDEFLPLLDSPDYEAAKRNE